MLLAGGEGFLAVFIEKNFNGFFVYNFWSDFFGIYKKTEFGSQQACFKKLYSMRQNFFADAR